MDPLILGSVTLLGLNQEELVASDRRLKRAGLFEVPRGSILALLAPTRGGLAKLVSIGRVLVTASKLSDTYSSYSPANYDELKELDEKIKEVIGSKNVVTPMERVKDGYLILAENVLREGIYYSGMGEFPDQGYLLSERWLDLAGLKGGIAGLWGRIWGRLFVLEPGEAVMLMLGFIASSPTMEELITEGEVEALRGMSQHEVFVRLLEGEVRRIKYMGWHLMRRGLS
ncbi:MAG: hypothetical protein NZ992_06955 [Candidatus Korarchaeum sp.]|nr:hypothetical protein [Candidatus Korarchaeum sp.]MDW8035313.1 hypothetical protein [Candidatus Korarchaeum sp.]